MSSSELIRQRLEESATVKQEMKADSSFVDLLNRVAQSMIDAYREGHKVLICGNGGSAADAQHIAAELVGKFYLKRDPLPAVSLTVNTSSLTAVGNDFSFNEVFVKQVQALAAKGDVVIGISTSGNSENVILALDEARRKGAISVVLTGKSGGKLKDHADYCLCIPSDDTPRIQEGHITAGHILCEIVERELFG